MSDPAHAGKWTVTSASNDGKLFVLRFEGHPIVEMKPAAPGHIFDTSAMIAAALNLLDRRSQPPAADEDDDPVLISTPNTPDWEARGRVHDWRNYVGRRTRAIWDSLTPAEQVAIARDAQERADQEHWD
ncbi:hypothetical protein [Reyranella sp.]|uniref:hypothetical protein n=1 Tax=Reyranella sp. TaxID=1929291 RepID=UPI004036D258